MTMKEKLILCSNIDTLNFVEVLVGRYNATI